MMDKIVVTAADIEKLLAWRDENNDFVRSMPVPLREVEIQIVESGISIKCFRSDKKLKLYLDSPARKLGHVVFAPLGNGLWKKKVSTLPADCNPTETEQGALTVYGSLMALMTYGTGSIRGEKSATSTKAPTKRIGSTKPHKHLVVAEYLNWDNKSYVGFADFYSEEDYRNNWNSEYCVKEYDRVGWYVEDPTCGLPIWNITKWMLIPDPDYEGETKNE